MFPEALITEGAFQHFHPGARGCSGVLLLAVLGASTVTDLRERRIRNAYIYPAAAVGLSLNLLLSAGVLLPGDVRSVWQTVLGGVGILEAMMGGTICFGVICGQFLVAGIGGGDVKLQTVLGVLLGWETGLEVWLLTMLLAGSYAATLLLFRFGRENIHSLALLLPGFRITVTEQLQKTLRQQLKRRLPLAPFFLLATCLSLTAPLFNSGRNFFSILFALP